VNDPAVALAGRRELNLLELPSVARMAGVLAERCREPSWVRTLVAALDRFGQLTGQQDLEELLAAARADPAVADRSLAALARALDGQPDAAVAGLAMGPKVWFRLNGVPVAWRQLPAAATARRLPEAGLAGPGERLLVLAPIGSGLHLAELLRVRVGDLGSLDADGRLLPEPAAEPLAVRYRQLRGGPAERVTFLSFPARAAVLDDLERRRLAGLDTGPEAPLVAGPDGRPAGRATVARARRRANAVIRAGSNVNVDLCRKTGEFFREWGLPGSRFTPVPELAATSTPEGGEQV
jgi:ribosomal protein L12E/L44/L45/RPP1/RPP2